MTGVSTFTVTSGNYNASNGVTVTGTTSANAIVVSNGAGSNAEATSLYLGGDLTTNSVAITGGSASGDGATLILNGSTNSLGAVTLTDNTGVASLELDSNVSVSGPINGASGTAQGTLEVVNGDVLSGDIGNLESLKQVDVYGDSATFDGAIYSATATTINSAGLMVFGGSSAQTRSG